MSDGLNVTVILHNRVIKAVFFLAECQYLCPIFLMFIAENPTAIILYFKYNNSCFCSYCDIYLRILSIRFLNI